MRGLNHDVPRRYRLAYLRGDDLEVVVAEDTLRGLTRFTKSEGLRRLIPVYGDEDEAEGKIILQCKRCGGTGLPHEMLADLDGKPYNSYEHIRCPAPKEW